jgi:UDP-glucose 4-epimerase
MVNVLEWMKTTKARRIVFNTTPSDICSSFDCPIPVSDDVPRSFPKNGGDHAVYTICKNAAVDILEHYKISYGFKPIVFRHLTVYGWNPDASYSLNGVKKILPWRQIMRKAIAGEVVEVWGDKNKKKELLYIDDFTEAIKIAVRTQFCGIYNLPGDKPYTLEEQIDGILAAFSSKVPLRKKYRPDMPSTPENLLCGDKIMKDLKWIPRVSWNNACLQIRELAKKNMFEKLWGKVDPSECID